MIARCEAVTDASKRLEAGGWSLDARFDGSHEAAWVYSICRRRVRTFDTRSWDYESTVLVV